MNFEEVYEKAESEGNYLNDRECIEIHIGSSTDHSISKGLFNTFQMEISKHGIKARVIAAGSFGYYGLEPIVLIEKPGRSTVSYNNVTPEIASELVNDYLMNDNPRPELALCSMGSDKINNIPQMSDLPLFKLQNRIALRNCGIIDPENINHYILRGQGYRGFSKALQMNQREVIEELKKSGLRGRGGAGYFTADKWKICHEAEASEKYVICNAVDADPLARTARLLLEGDPHSVLEGMLISAYAVGASRCIVGINTEYGLAIKRLKKAFEQMREYGLLGRSYSGFNFQFRNRDQGGSSFFCVRRRNGLPALYGRKAGHVLYASTLSCHEGIWRQAHFDQQFGDPVQCIGYFSKGFAVVLLFWHRAEQGS